MQKQIGSSVLEMALVGYQAELQKITANMSAIRKQLGVRGNGSPRVIATRKSSHHRMTTAGRKHIADAQKKRWAAFHAKHKAAAKPAKVAAPKRKLSPAAKAKLVANLAKARAARAAKKAAA
jgi:hypothetical protein